MASSQRPLKSCYVLVVDSEGETEILQLAYSTKWEDVSAVLQAKYDYQEKPAFTYTNEEEDYIPLGTQEAFEIALKLCKKNSDVLHIQIRKHGSPPLRPTRTVETSPLFHSQSPARPSLEHARLTTNRVLDWTSAHLRSTVHEIGQRLRNPSYYEDAVSMEETLNQLHPNLSQGIYYQGDAIQQSVLYPVSNTSTPCYETSVKEPVESDISVSTSEISEPQSSSPQRMSHSHDEVKEDITTRDNDIVMTIKEEIRKAISAELPVIRQEISSHVIENLASVKSSDPSQPMLASSKASDVPRSPKMIKDQIRELKREMREAKELKKRQKALQKASPTATSAVSARQSRNFAASFICENLVDGSCVEVGKEFVKYWVMKNEGLQSWDHTIQLEFLEENPHSEGSSVDPATSPEGRTRELTFNDTHRSWGPQKRSVPLPNVSSGATAVIAVRHVAPTHSCTYVSSWRLSHAGRSFGPRIWCSVNVVIKENLSSSTRKNRKVKSKKASTSGQTYANERFSQQGTSHDVKDDHEYHSDDFSNMLSFEMAAVGACNDPQPNAPQWSQAFTFCGPPTNKYTIHDANLSGSDEEKEPSESNNAPENIVSKEEEEKQAEIIEIDDDSTQEADDIMDVGVVSDFESIAEVSMPMRSVETSTTVDMKENEKDEGASASDEEEDADSDFEVIPIPECFDVSRPLPTYGSSDEIEEDGAASAGNSPCSLTPSNECKIENELVTTQNDRNTELDAMHLDSTGASPTPSLEKILPVHLEVRSRSTSNPTVSRRRSREASDEADPNQSTYTAPQSVLEADTLNTVVNHSEENQTLTQMTVKRSEPWIQRPIPLPRGSLNADKPMMKNTPTAPRWGELPSSPRSSTSSSSDVQSFQAWDAVPTNEDSTSHTGESPNEDDAPQIYYPPNSAPRDNQELDGDESTLAHHDLTHQHSPMQVLVPPDFPTVPALPTPAQPPQISTVVVPRDLSPMEQLIEMGFMDIDLNYDLLNEFQNDVSRAVNALVYRML